ncbi:MAG: hypothetical protein IAI50_20605 [Candidatus Eremiobacteraeota bacterium]|nr:hypothetical protein [Candidatus Eremiobacteraeota bacterium]
MIAFVGASTRTVLADEALKIPSVALNAIADPEAAPSFAAGSLVNDVLGRHLFVGRFFAER